METPEARPQDQSQAQAGSLDGKNHLSGGSREAGFQAGGGAGIAQSEQKVPDAAETPHDHRGAATCFAGAGPRPGAGLAAPHLPQATSNHPEGGASAGGSAAQEGAGGAGKGPVKMPRSFRGSNSDGRALGLRLGDTAGDLRKPKPGCEALPRGAQPWRAVRTEGLVARGAVRPRSPPTAQAHAGGGRPRDLAACQPSWGKGFG